MLIAISEGPQDVSFAEMVKLQESVGKVISSDPDVENYASFVGANSGQTGNTGRMFITLKPWSERTGGSVVDFINRIRPKLQQLQGVNLYLQPAQDIRVGGRLSRTQYQVHAAGRRSQRALRVGAEGAGQVARRVIAA